MADKRGMIPFLIGVICLTFLPCQTRALCLGVQEGQNLDNQISHEMEIHKIPSIASGIIWNDTIVWKKAYGQADRENGVPATTETIYLLASVSKLLSSRA
jgi:CubicO group peptidase (beta-lactamase class C family)